MGSFEAFLIKNAAESICKDRPCLWLFSVKRVWERKGIDLGIKANRSKRPGITVWSNLVYKVIFLTGKNNGQPKVDLNYCKRKEKLCSEMSWKSLPRIFITREGKKIFRFPKTDFLDTEKPLAEFCSDCEKEIFYSLKEVFSDEP